MVGLDHGSATPVDNTSLAEQARNSRLGLRLFAGYCLLYAAYMGLAAFRLEVFARPVVGGLNVGLVYGLTLIGGAMLLAFVYGWLCRNPVEDAAAGTRDKGQR